MADINFNVESLGMDPSVPLDILEYRQQAFHVASTRAIREVPLRILVHGRDMVTLQCTGLYPRFLVTGYLFGCGLIEGPDDIAAMDITEGPETIEARLELRFEPAWGQGIRLTSGMGREILTRHAAAKPPQRQSPSDDPTPAKPFLPPENILILARELHARSSLYNQTRGCHNASLCSPETMLVFRPDIGRHNAIDTIVGQCLLEGLPVADKMIVSTGRITSEMVQKAVRIGVGAYASLAVATSQAVECAKRHGLTLIGNVTDTSFWVYNDPGRVLR